MEERIQKILAKCGIASRRKAEDLILEGRVTVNGKIAALGMKADSERDHIKVNGKLIRGFENKVYIILNKPGKCITSLYDPEGRPTVKEFVRGVKAKVFPVGRLDYDAEGLLLMTNDGELAHAILHPKGEVTKTYLVKDIYVVVTQRGTTPQPPAPPHSETGWSPRVRIEVQLVP